MSENLEQLRERREELKAELIGFADSYVVDAIMMQEWQAVAELEIRMARWQKKMIANERAIGQIVSQSVELMEQIERNMAKAGC